MHNQMEDYAIDFVKKIRSTENKVLYIFQAGIYFNDFVDINNQAGVLREIKNLPNQNEVLLKNSFVDTTSSNLYLDNGLIGFLDIIKTYSIDLLVVETKETPHLFGLSSKDFQQIIIETINCPIIFISSKYQKEHVKKIVLLNNLEENIAVPFHKILSFSNAIDAELNVLQINTPDCWVSSENIKIFMDDFLENYDEGLFKMISINHINLQVGLLSFIREMNIDMLALVTHENYRIKYLSSSLTLNLLQNVTLPVYTVNIF